MRTEPETLTLAIPLTPAERTELTRCESVIEQGLPTVFQVGQAFRTIIERKLYRETHQTVEDYFRDRWQLSRPRAYQLIDGSKVYDNLSTHVDSATPLPINEAQVRALKKAPDERQADIWEKAVSLNDGKLPTGKQVKEVIDAEFQEIQKEQPSAEPEEEYYRTPHGVVKIEQWFRDEGKVEATWYREDLKQWHQEKIPIEDLQEETTLDEFELYFPAHKRTSPRDCTVCRWWSRTLLHEHSEQEQIPEGTGACLRPQGHCSPDIVHIKQAGRFFTLIRTPGLAKDMPLEKKKRCFWKCERCGHPTEWSCVRHYHNQLVCVGCLKFDEEQEILWSDVHQKAKAARNLEEDRLEMKRYEEMDQDTPFDEEKKTDRNADEYWFSRQYLTAWQLFQAERKAHKRVNVLEYQLEVERKRVKELEGMYDKLEQDFENWLLKAKGEK